MKKSYLFLIMIFLTTCTGPVTDSESAFRLAAMMMAIVLYFFFFVIWALWKKKKESEKKKD